MAIQGFYWHGISGDAGRPDMLGQWFVDDPVKVIAQGVAEAKTLGLRYMIALPAGYDRATAGPDNPDGTNTLMNSNLAIATLRPVFKAIADNSSVVAAYSGWHAALNWRTEPHRIDTMPMQKDARALSSADRRKWIRIHCSPLQAASNIRYWAFDGSQGDPAGLAVAEAELRRDEVADVYGELPPTLPGVGNDLILDAAKMAAYPSLGWVGQWDFCAKHKLHYSKVPAGIECHLVILPEFGAGFSSPPTNRPTDADIATAKANGWTIGVGSGWPLDMARAMLAVPAAMATDAA